MAGLFFWSAFVARGIDGARLGYFEAEVRDHPHVFFGQLAFGR